MRFINWYLQLPLPLSDEPAMLVKHRLGTPHKKKYPVNESFKIERVDGSLFLTAELEESIKIGLPCEKGSFVTSDLNVWQNGECIQGGDDFTSDARVLRGGGARENT